MTPAVPVTRVGVRSQALLDAARRVLRVADEVQDEAAGLAAVLAQAGPPVVAGPPAVAVLLAWSRAELSAAAVVGPAGAWGEALALEALALHLRSAARLYAGVERVVVALLHGVGLGTDIAARGGLLTDGSSTALLTRVEPTLPVDRDRGVADVGGLVAAGKGLDGGRVRVVELLRGDGGSAWVVVVPGTQEWSPRATANPFDLTTDLRAMTGDPTVAAAGVAAALAAARSSSVRSTASDPVLLVGHSQGGMLAAALASDPAFTRTNHVTHVVTSGSPVALFPVPAAVRVLGVEHGSDPVPRLDLTPNPAHASWLTVRSRVDGPGLDVTSHRLEGYVSTLRVLEAAPRGTFPELDAWRASAGGFLGRPVRSLAEYRVERGWQNRGS